MYGAGNETVDIADGQHHGAKHDSVFELGERLLRGQPLGLAQLDHGRDVLGADFVRVDDLQRIGQRDALCSGHVLDGLPLAEQHAAGNAFFFADGRSTDGTRLFAFRQNDALDHRTRLLDELVAERRGRKLGGFGDAERSGDGVGVEMLGNGFEHGVDAFDVVFGNGPRGFDDSAGRLERIVFGSQDWYAVLKHRADQFHQLRVNGAGMGEQDAGNRDAAADRERGREDDAFTVAACDDQCARSQVRDELRGRTSGHDDVADATGGDFAFADDLGLELAGNVEGARRLKLRGFRNDAPELDGAELVLGGFLVEGLGRHVEDDAGDFAAFARKLARAQLEVVDGVRLRAAANQHDFGLQAVGDVDVELRGEGVRGVGMKAFDDQDVGVLAGVHAERDNVFEHVGALARGNAFGDGFELDRVRRIDIEDSAYHSAGVVLLFLPDRLDEADLHPQSLQGVDDAQRDRGQAGVQMDGGNKEGLCLALTHFVLPEETRCSKTYNYPPSAPAYKERFRDV